MTGYNEFIKLFGEITVLNVVEFVLAALFLWFLYKKVKDYLIKKHNSESQRDNQLKKALEAVKKFPTFEAEIQELRKMQEENTVRLVQMEEQNKRRERNKLRDRLLQNYRYYTNIEMNPSQSWTKMEAEAFWELFRDYEDADGDGYIHTVVQPEMERLAIIEIK